VGDYQIEDLLGDVSQGTAAAALTYEAFRDTPHKMYFFAHNADDTLHCRLQLSHGWQLGTNVEVHLHWIPMVDPSSSPQNIIIDGYYYWAKYDEVIPELASWTAISPKITIPVVTGDAFKHKRTTIFTATPPAGALVSDVLLIYLRRPGASDGDDTYSTSKAAGTATANMRLLYVDGHFHKGRHGLPQASPL